MPWAETEPMKERVRFVAEYERCRFRGIQIAQPHERPGRRHHVRRESTVHA